MEAPVEIRTEQGVVIPAITRDISFSGIGFLHRDSIPFGEIDVDVKTDACVCTFKVAVIWCSPCENGMFMSGGQFIPESSEPGESNS